MPLSESDSVRGSLGAHIQKTAEAVGAWPEWMKPAYLKEAEMAESSSYRRVSPMSPLYGLGIRWVVTAPDGSQGSLKEGVHTVTEHEDGTITVEPSLVMPSGWHGWLRRGVFTSV